ncbi:MAG: hypothetical protein IIT64_03650 [Bacteroidaceae bacterium]|nr:hypothetical protein [Bacteroidaceae bacterium]
MAKSTGGTRGGSSNNPTGNGAPSSGVTVEYLRNNIGSSRQRLAELENSGQGESEEARNLRVGIRLAEQMLERRGAAINASRNISEPRNMSLRGRMDSIIRRLTPTKAYQDMSVRELRNKLEATQRAIRNVDAMETETLTQSDESSRASAVNALTEIERALREELNRRNNR